MKRGKRNQDKRKKEERKLEKKYNSSDSSRGKLITVLIVVFVFALFYFLTIYLTNRDNSSKQKESLEKDTSSEIILGRSFSMKDSEYLVLYYDSSNEEISSTCESLFTNYKAGHGDGSIYYVDMNSGFNKSYVTDGESNKTPSSVSDLLINGPTLIKVDGRNVVEYIEGIEEVTNYLNS